MLSPIGQGSQEADMTSSFDVRFQTTIDALCEGLAYCRLIYDPDGTAIDFEFLAVNRALVTLFGGMELVGKRGAAVFPGAARVRPSLFQALQRVASSRKPESDQFYAPRFERWLDITASCPSPGELVLVTSDITEKRQADLAMRRKDSWLDALTDYLLWLDCDGRVLEVTESASRHLEYSREELLNMTIFDLDPDILGEEARQSAKARADLWNADRQLGSFVRETRHKAKSGRMLPIEMSVSAATIDGVEYEWALCRDISERTRMQESLRITQLSVDRAPDMIHWMDAKGLTVYANEAMCTALGYSAEEFKNLHVWDFDLEVTPELLSARFESRREVGVFQRQTILGGKDGRRITVQISATCLELGGRDLLISFFRDITEQKAIEESLRTTQLTVDQSPDMVHWVDGEGRLVYVNGATADFLGYTREQMQSLHLWDIAPDMNRARLEARRAAGGASAPTTGEMTWMARDGRQLSVEVTSCILDLPGRTLGIGYGRDIARRKQAEQSLKDSEELYHRMFNIGFSALFMLDNDTLNIIDANEAATALYGYSKEELFGMSMIELSAEPDKTAQVLAGEIMDVPQRMHLRKDGTVFPVEAHGRRFEWKGRKVLLAAIRDMTERRRAEEALQESQQMLRLVLDTVPMHVAWKDSQLRFLGCNSSVALDARLPDHDAIVGLTQQDIPLLGLPDSCAQDDLEVLSTGIPRLQFEEVFTPPDASPRIVRSSKVPLRDREGRIFGVLGVHEDVTERRAMLKTLRERDEQLRQSQKMEAIGRLAGGIAHDFNNVVTTIIGYSDLVLDSPGAGAESITADVGEIRAAAERARALTRQILAFSRRQALEPRVLSLNDVIGDTERLLARTIGADIELKVVCEENLDPVEVDEHELVQVMLNLAVNARDAMPAGGTLTLETANVDLSEEFCQTHPDAHPGPHVLVSMSDTGTGMDAETAARIFEPFYTTKPPGQGTGLGLSTVYGVVAQSGGCTYVQSEPGQGTRFDIYLPRHDGPSSDDDMETQPGTSHATVLLVDDDSAFRKVTTRMLEKRGFRVLAVREGDQAVDILGNQEKAVDLLLTDVVLPGSLQGIHVAQRASSLRPGIPIIYMSAYSRDSIVKAGRLGENEDYLEKPFTAEHVVTRIREMLNDRSG
jgi:two-component system cell cycle sensor histidine kinase/response regulator CckA